MTNTQPIKIAFISATSGFTLGAAAHLMRRREVSEGSTLVLYAPPEEEADLQVMAQAVQMMAGGEQSGLKIESTVDRRQALDGADFVVTALRAGRLEAHRIDIELPKEYGIYQIVGDTINPGGIFAALRNYGVIGTIAEDMKRYSAEDAWIVNMSNPEGSICRMVHEGNSVPVVGLCPGVYGLKRFLARALDVDEDRLVVEIAGFNHLTWVTRLELDGVDAYPLLLEKYAEKGPQGQPISFMILKKFGLYPSPADRHVAEFFPFFLGEDAARGADYGLSLRDVDAMLRSRQTGWTDLQRRVHDDDLRELYQNLGGEAMGGFMIAEVVENLLFDHGRTLQVNTRNRTSIPGLPPEAFVEAPARIDSRGVHPLAVSPLPTGVLALLSRVFAQQELIVKAALEGDRQAIVQALLLDPSLERFEHAAEIADRMLEAHRAYLPMFPA